MNRDGLDNLQKNQSKHASKWGNNLLQYRLCWIGTRTCVYSKHCWARKHFQCLQCYANHRELSQWPFLYSIDVYNRRAIRLAPEVVTLNTRVVTTITICGILKHTHTDRHTQTQTNNIHRHTHTDKHRYTHTWKLVNRKNWTIRIRTEVHQIWK